MAEKFAFERKIAKQALLEWLKAKLPIDRILHETFQEHRVGSAQRSPIADVVYALVRNWNLYLKNPAQPENRQWMRDLEEAIAENFSAGPEKFLRRHLAAKPLVDKNPLEHITRIHGISSFLLEQMKSQPLAWHDYLHTMMHEAPFSVRVNTLKIEAPAFLERYQAHEPVLSPFIPGAVRFAKRWHVLQDEGFKEGLFEIQDEHSQLVSLLAQPQAHEKVLDLCAGAGGKALHLATLMAGKGEVVAYDISKRKLQELNMRARRAGLNNIRICEKLPEAELFDVVLADVPCSGLGTLRRSPDRLMHFSLEESRQLRSVQNEILRQAFARLKPEGRLIYSTCTVLPEENILRIRENLLNRPQKLQNISERLKSVLGPSAPSFLLAASNTAAAKISAFDDFDEALQLGPSPESHASGGLTGDGFFMALVK